MPALTSAISVTFDDDAKTIAIADNGDGMSQEDVSAFFTKIGSSAAQLAEKTAGGSYKAVGEFGIGVVSYFLVCDRFQVHTVKEGNPNIGLEFAVVMLDGATPAEAVSCQRTDIGTTLILFVKSSDIFEHLLTRYPHWVRDVAGVTATKQPGDLPIGQGGLRTAISEVEVTLPAWCERAHLGPPQVFSVWDTFDGRAHVDVLYRGVFVDRVTVDRLWGIEGCIHVDPKHFQPKLNREGFVGGQLTEEVTRFLQDVHPAVLFAAVTCLQGTLAGDATSEWTMLRWATLWLAVPRGGKYAAASARWDEDFRHRKAFRLLLGDGTQRDVSIADIQQLETTEVYLAPNLNDANDLVRQAVRVLRARDLPVVQGVGRDTGYLGHASLSANSTSDLLIQYFAGSLPPLVHVERVASGLIEKDALACIYQGPPRVRLVALGPNGAPMVGVGDAIWINSESSAGRLIVLDVCERNEGFVGLWLAFLRHAPGHVPGITGQLGNLEATPRRLGPVRRQYLRRLVS
jgi:hypothetical protein